MAGTFTNNPRGGTPFPYLILTTTFHQVAGLTEEAENVAENLIRGILEGLVEGQQPPGQIGLSSRIRDRLDQEGITTRLDEVAARLLPNQVR